MPGHGIECSAVCEVRRGKGRTVVEALVLRRENSRSIVENWTLEAGADGLVLLETSPEGVAVAPASSNTRPVAGKARSWSKYRAHLVVSSQVMSK